MSLTMTMNAAIRAAGVAALLLVAQACVVTPEPIPLFEASPGYDAAVLGSDTSADLMEGIDVLPPANDAVQPPPPDLGPAPLDASPDGAVDGGPTEIGPPEGGPQEAGPIEAGSPSDLGQGEGG